jgi:hypothetical protein
MGPDFEFRTWRDEQTYLALREALPSYRTPAARGIKWPWSWVAQPCAYFFLCAFPRYE